MNDTPRKTPAQNHKILELALHDGLDHLEDYALMMAFQSHGNQFEILSITAPPASHKTPSSRTTVNTNDTVVGIHEVLLKKTA